MANEQEPIDWHWQGWRNGLLGFLRMCLELDMSGQVKLRALRKQAKKQKKRAKRRKRQVACYMVAGATNRAIKNIINKS